MAVSSTAAQDAAKQPRRLPARLPHRPAQQRRVRTRRRPETSSPGTVASLHVALTALHITVEWALDNAPEPRRLSASHKYKFRSSRRMTICHLPITVMHAPRFTISATTLLGGVSRKTTWILAKPKKEVDKSGKSTKKLCLQICLEG